MSRLANAARTVQSEQQFVRKLDPKAALSLDVSSGSRDTATLKAGWVEKQASPLPTRQLPKTFDDTRLTRPNADASAHIWTWREQELEEAMA